MGSVGESSHTPFRLAEKYWKNRAGQSVPSLVGKGVLDLSRPEGEQDEDEVWQAGWWARPALPGPDGIWSWRKKSRKGKEVDRGVRPPVELGDGVREVMLKDGRRGWVVAPGCVLLPRYLNPSEQLSLLRSALAEYTLPPNPLSLSTHYALPSDLFSAYARNDPITFPPKWNSLSSEDQAKYANIPRQGRTTIETLPGSVLGYDEILSKNRAHGDGAVPSSTVGAKTSTQLMEELRWANLGWVYQWTTKSYDFSPQTPIPFPSTLAEICKKAVESVPWNEVYTVTGETSDDVRGTCDEKDWASWGNTYLPDTGIVNYYRLKDTLMGHVDRAELDPSRPLVSISLGHACIFLLGSSSRQDPPRPIILRSGDVLITSGPSRQSYHGVPRVMEGTLPAHFLPLTGGDQAGDGEGDDEVMKACKRYIAGARVNINAREVFPPGFQRPAPLAKVIST